MGEKPVAGILGQAWSNCGAVLLFTLLGASLDASKLSPQLVGMGVLLVVLGLVGRSITLFFTLFLFPQWGVKEKLYSMVSWRPWQLLLLITLQCKSRVETLWRLIQLSCSIW